MVGRCCAKANEGAGARRPAVRRFLLGPSFFCGYTLPMAAPPYFSYSTDLGHAAGDAVVGPNLYTPGQLTAAAGFGPLTTAPDASEAATDVALVLAGASAPFTVKKKALVMVRGAVDTVTGFTMADGAAVAIVPTSANYSALVVGNQVSLDFVLQFTPTSHTTMVLTIDLSALTAASGSAAVTALAPTGGTFAATTAARGWGSIPAFDANPAASVAQTSSVASVAADDKITVTVVNTLAFDTVVSSIRGRVWYDLTA